MSAIHTSLLADVLMDNLEVLSALIRYRSLLHKLKFASSFCLVAARLEEDTTAVP